MTQRKQTKLILSNDKFEQLSIDNLNLSGNTNIYGQLVIIQGAGVGKVLTSNAQGVAAWGDVNVTASGDAIRKTINQSSHGFLVQDVVGYSGNTYNKPIADGTYDGEILGLVNRVIDVDNFEFTHAGYIAGLTGLVQSTTYFLSPDTVGLLTSTEPITDGHLSKTILLADSTTSGWVLPYVGYIVTTGDTTSIIVDSELNTGSTNPVENQAIATVINQILAAIAVAPTYVAPTASFTTTITQTVERGTTLTNFAANITFTQNDAGLATGYQLNRNGSFYSSTQNNTVTESNIISNTTFQGIVSYVEGPTKENNLGILDPTGKILAGSVNTTNRTITPRLRQFWGSTTGVPTTSADVRGLSNNNFETTNTFNLITGTVNRFFAVAIPSTKSLVSVIDTGNLNVNITSQYELINASFTVLDAGGNNTTFKLYVMENDVPYPTSTTHVITVS